jgi:hypothetical protein
VSNEGNLVVVLRAAPCAEFFLPTREQCKKGNQKKKKKKKKEKK